MSFKPSPSGSKTGCNYTCKLYFDPRADQPSTGGYWITDKELREKLANFIDTEEQIKNASVYSNPLFPWQGTNANLYHAFVVIETNEWWWSIEKNREAITIQRSKSLGSVRDMYQRQKRTTGWTTWTKIRKNETTGGGNTTIKELINYIWRKDCLNDVYFLVDANCQHFAAMVFDRIKSPHKDQVYLDEAADQPPTKTSSCYMSVDQVFSEVQRLSASETFTKLEIYKVPISSWDSPDFSVPVFFLPFFFIYFAPIVAPILFVQISALGYSATQISELLTHQLFVIFETNDGTYWSFERLPTCFTIQRARNKDILLQECQRISRGTLFSNKNLVKSDVAVQHQNMNAVLEFIWKKEKLAPFYLPGALCSREVLEIYDRFIRK